MIATLFRRHPLLGIHLVIIGLLLVGLVQRSGMDHLAQMAGYVAVLLSSYFLLDRIVGGWTVPDLRQDKVKLLAWTVLLLTCSIAVAHWAFLGQVPLIAAMGEQDDLVVQSIRLHMTEDIPTWMAYASNILIKALIPVTLVLCYKRFPRLFLALAIAGGIYAISLVQKSYIITLFVPLWVAFLISKRWWSFSLLTGGFVLITALLLLVAQPEKLDRDAVADDGKPKKGLVEDLVTSVMRRVVLMPGWTVSAWFEYIPEQIPFQEGSAVRPLALVLGKPYHALDREVYDIEYPVEAAKHTEGTMGSASFMYGWANFGLVGLLLSGVITAVVLRLITLLFAGDWRWAICVNVFPLLVLSSVALTTVLLTHGWAVTLLLGTLFRPSEKLWR